MLSLNETIDQFAMANNLCWRGHVLRMVNGHVLRALEFEVKGTSIQKKKRKPKRSCKKQVEEDSMKDGLRMEDAIF